MSKKRVLVIEDNKDICELIEMMLSDKFDVSSINDLNAIDWEFSLSGYDLVITDYLLGTKTAEFILNRFSESKFMVMSALSSSNAKIQKIISKKGVSFIQKPFEVEEFVKMVISLTE